MSSTPSDTALLDAIERCHFQIIRFSNGYGSGEWRCYWDANRFVDDVDLRQAIGAAVAEKTAEKLLEVPFKKG